MKRQAIRAAGPRYAYLRGVLSIPAGFLFLLAALGNWQVGPLRHDLIFFACVVAIALAYGLVVRYYQDHYGRMSPSPGQQLRGAAAVGLGLVIVVGGSLLLRSQAGWSLDLPVNAIAVTFAVVMLASYAIWGVLHAHHLVVWGSLFLAGALPLWAGADPSNVGLVMCGVAVIVCGVFDHIAFVRTFGPRDLPAAGEGNARA